MFPDSNKINTTKESELREKPSIPLKELRPTPTSDTKLPNQCRVEIRVACRDAAGAHRAFQAYKRGSALKQKFGSKVRFFAASFYSIQKVSQVPTFADAIYRMTGEMIDRRYSAEQHEEFKVCKPWIHQHFDAIGKKPPHSYFNSLVV